MVSAENKPIIFIISDSIGETGELMAKAAASQFNHHGIEIRRLSYVIDPDEIPELLESIKHLRCVVAFTLVVPELRNRLLQEAERLGIPTVDLLTPMMDAVSGLVHNSPKNVPGLVRKTDAEYFHKVEAIEFAVKYDDGKDPRGITRANLVILGVSRTSKTPLCMYLAHLRLKAANIPLVPEVSPPDELKKVPLHRLIGLTIKPQQLYEIRRERLNSLGLPNNADYASMERILKELDYAEGFMKRIGCSIIDVTNKAVEETASRVLEIYYRGERLVR
ncbi:MAG: kinase/pyrophosphorylase [Peptococcaceae bacterium]|jgi:regulator of PEP synthase PpsR (kinase-PPPase family)|nr:kinase/pyrophosphorylase [Peptococcaceae bacterium]